MPHLTMAHLTSLAQACRLFLAPSLAAGSGREEWRSIRRLSEWGNTRRFRRIVVLVWIVLLSVDPWMMVHLSGHFTFLAGLPALILPTVSQLLITWLAFRAMCIGLAQPSIEDTAQIEFNKPFDRLSNAERDKLVRLRLRDVVLGNLRKDERETNLSARAEIAAYRLLRPGLTIAAAAWWAICLLGPFEQIRTTLTVTAIAFTWGVVAILVLPTMIRMWTQPNEAGETRIVGPGDDA